jgi:hypothetical protein
MSRRLAVLCSALALTPGVLLAAECGWLATGELDRLLPELAPWSVITGGEVGSCQFLSRAGGPPNIFGANQMVQASAAAATDFVQGLRTETEKSYEVTAEPVLGEQGFVYRAREEGEGGRSIFYVGHRGSVAVLGTLTLQHAVTADEHAAGAELMQAALGVADDETALAAASDCPWLDAGALAPMLPGGGVTQQTFGENSCLAQDAAGAVVMVSVQEAIPALVASRGGGCTWEAVPTLGEDAALGYSCSEGNPRATLRMVVGDRLIEYNLVPGAEPTEAQRQALLDMAALVRQRRLASSP